MSDLAVSTQPSGDKPGDALFGPVTQDARITSVDTLRGVAILGILVMNIYAFAMPFAGYSNPLAYGGSGPLHHGTWAFTHLFFDEKFMAIFSMLFGAGLILMLRRAEAADRSLKGIYYRRMLWLLVIGGIHAYGIWSGDILVPYALCGLVLYPFRKRSPKVLIILAVILLFVGAALRAASGGFMMYARKVEQEIAQTRAEGKEPLQWQVEMVAGFSEMREFFKPTEEDLQKNVAIRQNGFAGILEKRVESSLMMHLQAMPFMIFWRVCALMLLGMALMKAGVFSAGRSRKFYARLAASGYGVGLPVVFLGYWQQTAHEFDFARHWLISSHFSYFGSILVALAHISMVMLLCKSDIWTAWKRRLSAVGQMALTNYLMQSVILTTIFYGYGLGLYGTIDRFWLMGFVVGTWILQLIISPWWFARFRFGPAEWLWRSLTYWRWQPMRATSG